MLNFDNIFALAKKLSQSLLKEKGLCDLDEADFLSEESKIHVKQQLSEEEIKENLELLNQIDKEAAWNQIEHRMAHSGNTKPGKRHLIPSFYKAAAVIVLLLSLTYIVYLGRKDSTVLESGPMPIVAGTDKAVLTLEDGSEVLLEKGRTFSNGTVHGTGERLEYTATKKASATAFNILTIPRGGQYQLVLSDGTRIWLNADTKIKYPVNFVEGEPRNLELVYGEAYFKVSPSSKHQGCVFRVISDVQEVEVLGTEFNIKAYNDEQHLVTTLVEGTVKVAVDEEKLLLFPNDQVIMGVDGKSLEKHKVNVDYDIAWVRGYFNFKDKPLKDIMKVLSRWYDVDIVFDSKALQDTKFSGLLNRKQNIEDILEGIQHIKSINAYEIKNKTITIK